MALPIAKAADVLSDSRFFSGQGFGISFFHGLCPRRGCDGVDGASGNGSLIDVDGGSHALSGEEEIVSENESEKKSNGGGGVRLNV